MKKKSWFIFLMVILALTFSTTSLVVASDDEDEGYEEDYEEDEDSEEDEEGEEEQEPVAGFNEIKVADKYKVNGRYADISEIKNDTHRMKAPVYPGVGG